MKSEKIKNILPVGTILPLYETSTITTQGTITSSSNSNKLIDSNASFETFGIKKNQRILNYLEYTNFATIETTSSANNTTTILLNPDDTNGLEIGDITIQEDSLIYNTSQNKVTFKLYYLDGSTEDVIIECVTSGDMISAPKNINELKIWKIDVIYGAVSNSGTSRISTTITYLKIDLCVSKVLSVDSENEITTSLNCYNTTELPNFKYKIFDLIEIKNGYDFCDGHNCNTTNSILTGLKLPCLNIKNSFLIGANTSGGYQGCNYHLHSVGYSGSSASWGYSGLNLNHTHLIQTVDSRPETLSTIFIIKVL